MKIKKRNIKIRILLILCLSMIAVSVGCSSSKNNDKTVNKNDLSSTDGEKVTLRYADNQPAGYPSVEAAEEFAKIVSEKTDGRIEIKIYPGGQLGDEKSNIEQLGFGALDFARVSMGPLSEFAPSLNVLQLPYLFRDADHMWNVVEGEIGSDLLLATEDAGIIGLCWYDAGSRNFYNSKHEVKTLAELSKLKIRVMESELMMDMAKSVGVNPTPMNSGEVYSALQSGIIEGAENNIPTYVANAHNEVAKYFTMDEHIRIPEPMLMSKKTMEKLTDADQEIIREAAKEASKIQRELWNKYQEDAIKKAEEKGTIFTELTPEAKQEFQDACKPMYEKYAAEYKDLVDDIINTK